MSTSSSASSPLDSVLDATESIFLENGFDGVSLDEVGEKSGVSRSEIAALFPSELDLLVALTNRELLAMYRGIMANIERDPRGGLLSRIYTYSLTHVYERPIARALYMSDKNALSTLMRHRHAMMHVPTSEDRRELIESLQSAGMVRSDCDPGLVSDALTVLVGGLALTAPHERLDVLVESFMGMFGRAYDAEVEDTSPGKQIYFAWASRLGGELS